MIKNLVQVGVNMISHRNKGIVRISDIWFEEARLMDIEKKCDFVQYHDMRCSLEDHKYLLSATHYKTIVNDLIETEQEIMARFRSNVRNEIRRARKEGVEVENYDSKRLKSYTDIIVEFDEHHLNMCKQKGMPIKSEYKTLLAYINSNMLAVTIAKHNDSACVYHVYICDSEKLSRVRLLHSVSVFRELTENAERNAIGRANRMLHYEDMVLFKKLGYAKYDWGGYSQRPEHINIAEFKAGFGGYVENITRYVFACNWAAKIAVTFKMMLRGLYKFGDMESK
jgi:hypothetical protein